MCSLFWLCHSSTPVSDERCQAELERIATKLNCLNVELRSTNLLRSAGTAGWFRPLIFLPDDFETYTDEELRAVLAHELAHVDQGDFAWRLLVGLYAAVHYCNPLAHWLRARLILEQELLADRIASEVIGNRLSYAQTLSRLAIRADAAKPNLFHTGLLSVTSTNLLRRIEMLRAKDGSAPRSVVLLSLGVTLMILTTIAATGLRASAETTGAAVTAVKDGIRSDVTPFDVRQLPFSQQGAFVVRPSMLLGKQMGSYGPLVRAWFSGYLEHMGLGDVSLDKIEFVAGGFRAQVHHMGKTIEPGDEGHEHQLSLDSHCVLIRLHEPQDLVARIKELFPNAEVIDKSKRLFLLPTIYPIGPRRFRLKVVNDRNLAVSFTKKGHEWIADYDSYPKEEHPWEQQWRSADKGAVTVLFDETAMSWPKTMKTWPSSVRTLFDKTDFLSVALSPGETFVDADGATTFPQLNCNATLKENVRTDQSKVADLITEIAALFSGVDEPQTEFIAQWLRRSKVSLSRRTVGLSGSIVFPIGSNETEVAAVKAETVPDPESIQLHFKLVEFDVKKLQGLNIDFLSADEVAADTSGKFSTTEVAYALISCMARNPKASLALIEKTCGKGKLGEIGQILAEPVLTTVSDRPAGSGWDDGNRVRFVPRLHHHPDAIQRVTVKLELSGELDWKTELTTRPGTTSFLPLPWTNGENDMRRMLVWRTEVPNDNSPAAEIGPKTAGRPVVNKKVQ